MPTRPIPPNTVNTTLNVPRAWRMIVGKAAYARGLSMGEFLKQCVERSLAFEEPDAAMRLRASRHPVAGGIVALVLLISMGAQWISARHDDMARCRTQVRTVRGAKKGRDTAADGEWFLGREAA